MNCSRTNLFLDNKALPKNPFSKVFRSYLFFDELSSAVKTFEGAAAEWVDQDQQVLINSVFDQRHKDCIRWSDGLSEKSVEFQILQEKNDDLFGQNICALDKSWAIHHYSPVSFGILAIDTQRRQIVSDLRESGWLITSAELLAEFHSKGSAWLDRSYGSGFTTTLIQECKLDNALDGSK